jgi:hypothetical protein
VNTDLMPILERNPELMRRAKFVNMTFAVAEGDRGHVVTIADGRVNVLPAGTASSAPVAFTIAAAKETWAEFSRPEPAPGFNDVIAMAETDRATIEGADLLSFFQNMLLVKGVIFAMVKGDATW